MFFHLQYIHLFRPFLKYAPSASPLPGHVSPRRICTANAGAISKLTRLYKKAYDLRQICNIAVYMIHSACTIHLLNLPDKSARCDITHGVKHLDEIAEDWLCARRTLSMLSVLARKWQCELPEEAASALKRAEEKYGQFSMSDDSSLGSSTQTSPMPSDEDAAAVSRNDNSPLSHYTEVHVSQFTPPAASLDSQLQMMPPALQMMGGGPRLGPQHRPDLPFDAGRMEFSPDVLNGWTSQPANVPEPRYDSPLLHVDGVDMVPEGNGQCSTRQVSPGQEVTFDGQRWILNDSARWDQNLEGWDMGGGVPGGPVFLFGDNRNRGVHHGAPDAGNPGRANMEAVAAPLSDKGWLAGLE